MISRVIDLVVVHTLATKPGANVGVDKVREWHVNERGWRDIGYHYVIRRSGRIELGRPIDEPGAHARGANWNSAGVALEGGLSADGVPEDNYPDEQYGGLEVLLRYLIRTYPVKEICGHRDLSPDLNDDGVITPDEWIKDCPCFDVSVFLKARGILPLLGESV